MNLHPTFVKAVSFYRFEFFNKNHDKWVAVSILKSLEIALDDMEWAAEMATKRQKSALYRVIRAY